MKVAGAQSPFLAHATDSPENKKAENGYGNAASGNKNEGFRELIKSENLNLNNLSLKALKTS